MWGNRLTWHNFIVILLPWCFGICYFCPLYGDLTCMQSHILCSIKNIATNAAYPPLRSDLNKLPNVTLAPDKSVHIFLTVNTSRLWWWFHCTSPFPEILRNEIAGRKQYVSYLIHQPVCLSQELLCLVLLIGLHNFHADYIPSSVSFYSAACLQLDYLMKLMYMFS